MENQGKTPKQIRDSKIAIHVSIIGISVILLWLIIFS